MSRLPATLLDGTGEEMLDRDGFAIIEIGRDRLDALEALYAATRPAELTEFTATIQLDDPERRSAVHHGVREILRPCLEQHFVDHRIVAGNFVVKQPGPWLVEPHQDFDFVDEQRWRAVLGWIPLHDVDPSNGCLHVVPGSHRLATLPRGSGDHRFPFAPVLDHLKARRSVAVPLRRGQAVLYDARTLHWSTGNDTGHERVAGAFAAIPSAAELLHCHVNDDDTVTVLAVDDDIYADTPFHGYPVRGREMAVRHLDDLADYDTHSVDAALDALDRLSPGAGQR